MMTRHRFRSPRGGSRRALILAAIAGLGCLGTAGTADANPHHRWHKHHGRYCERRTVVVREAPCVAPVICPVAAPCGPVVAYHQVWQPGYWQWDGGRGCDVWVPGAMIVVRF
jgi:hypothetical protein